MPRKLQLKVFGRKGEVGEAGPCIGYEPVWGENEPLGYITSESQFVDLDCRTCRSHVCLHAAQASEVTIEVQDDETPEEAIARELLGRIFEATSELAYCEYDELSLE